MISEPRRLKCGNLCLPAVDIYTANDMIPDAGRRTPDAGRLLI